MVVCALLPGDLGCGVRDLVHPHVLRGPRRACSGVGNQAQSGEALGITSRFLIPQGGGKQIRLESEHS